MPLSVTVCGLSNALSVKVRVPVRTPVCDGVKVTGIALDIDGLKLKPGMQAAEPTLNSAGSLEQAPETIRVVTPLLMMVTLVGALVVASFSFPKS